LVSAKGAIRNCFDAGVSTKPKENSSDQAIKERQTFYGKADKLYRMIPGKYHRQGYDPGNDTIKHIHPLRFSSLFQTDTHCHWQQGKK